MLGRNIFFSELDIRPLDAIQGVYVKNLADIQCLYLRFATPPKCHNRIDG